MEDNLVLISLLLVSTVLMHVVTAVVFWFNDWLDYYKVELYKFHHEKIGLEENKGGK